MTDEIKVVRDEYIDDLAGKGPNYIKNKGFATNTEGWEKPSQTCSNCNHINKTLTLDQREWTCKNCQSKLDRDMQR